jgi:hypothetical protein
MRHYVKTQEHCGSSCLDAVDDFGSGKDPKNATYFHWIVGWVSHQHEGWHEVGDD